MLIYEKEDAMSTNKRNLVLIIGLILVISTACALPAGLLPKGTDSPSVGDIGATVEALVPNLPDAISTAPDPKPIPLQEGLGSLDSYNLAFHFLSTDSTDAKSGFDEVIQSSVVDGNSHSVVTNVSKAPEDTQDTTTTSEIYTIGTVTCTYSDGEWAYSKQSDQDKEMQEAFSHMIDVVPVLKDPVFVAEENINGIQTNHFTFKVTGIGSKSGAVATQNQGDYWLAKDGQFLVKYLLVLLVQSAPEGSSEAKISSMDISYELSAVNQPVIITQPADCQPTSE
jgi:hypothetical protein